MPYCSQCGVEVDAHTQYCPLCAAPIQKVNEAGEPRLPAYPQEDRERPEDRRARSRIRRMIAFQIVTLALATPLVVVVVTDLLFGRYVVSWSSYVAVSLAVVWVYAAVPLLLPSSAFRILLIDVAATAAFLAVLDLLSGGIDWFVPLGLPLIGAVVLIAVAIWLLSRRARRLGANLAGYILVAVAAVAVITETVVESYLSGPISLDWSLIVAVATLPVAVSLLYIHFVLSRHIDLKRRFHI